MTYNLLENAYLTTCPSGIGWGTLLTLTSSQLNDVRGGRAIIVPSGRYIALEAQFATDFLVNSVSMFLSSATSGQAQCTYNKIDGAFYSADGKYNYRTDYCTPVMTSSSTPSGVIISATSHYSNRYPYNAFNQTNISIADSWYINSIPSSAAPHTLMIEFLSPRRINRYAILSLNDASYNTTFPKTWTFEAHTGTTTPSITSSGGQGGWVILDTRSNEATSMPNAWSSYYNFDNISNYKCYRIRITASTGSALGIGEFKLVEAQSLNQYTKSAWSNIPWTWSGNQYSYSFNSPQGVGTLRFFYKNTSPEDVRVTFAADHILKIMASGNITPSGIDFISFTPTVAGPLLVDIKNEANCPAEPKFSVGYTGNFEIDRNIFVSTDYPISSGIAANWFGLDSTGFCVPENYDWERGLASGVRNYRRRLILDETQVSGIWTSPVLDLGDDPTWLYTYYAGEIAPLIEVKTSDTLPPPKAHFALIATENTHQNLMYKHKRIVFDDRGEIIESVICDSENNGNKIWRLADAVFAGKPLYYYGCVNNRGTAAFMCPGVATCGDMDPVQEATNADNWYNLCMCKLTSTSGWTTGTSISGMSWGSDKTVLYTRTLPVENYDGFFAGAIVTDMFVADYYHSKVYMSYHDGNNTRTTFPIVTFVDQTLGEDDRMDIQYDWANSGWWIYIGGSIQKIYKADVGSINAVKIYKGDYHMEGSNKVYDVVCNGYLYEKDFYAHEFTGLVGIPNKDFSGFWALTTSGVYLYQENYEYEVATIDERCELLHSDINNAMFTEIYCGCADSYGNLWAIDADQHRLIRVNIDRVLKGQEQPIDYDNTISGVMGVVPHPTNGIAYILVSDAGDYPGIDTLQMVSATQQNGSLPRCLCRIPGFASADHKYGTHFSGYVYPSISALANDDPYWGESLGGWVKYEIGKESLPRGRYKQFRITLTRPDLTTGSPQVERIRIPAAIALHPLDKDETRQVAIKTSFDRTDTRGEFSPELRIWWEDLGYNG